MSHAIMRDLDSQFDEVTVNGKTQEVAGMYLTYEQAVKIAFPEINIMPKDIIVTIAESKPNWKEAQTLTFGNKVDKYDNMFIKCHYAVENENSVSYLSEILNSFKWIQGDGFNPEQKLSIEEKYEQLQVHHKDETEWLISKCRELAKELIKIKVNE